MARGDRGHGMGCQVLTGFRLERADMHQRRDGCEAGCHRVISVNWCPQDSGKENFLVGDVSKGS